jgi:cell division septation protein DedD
MSYDFSFSKKAISFVVAGSIFVGVMLFIAGLLVGTTWKAEPKAAPPVAGTQPVATPQPEPTVDPQEEPVMSAEAVIPETAAPGAIDAAREASTPVKQAHGNTVSASGRRWQSPQSAAAAPNDDELRVVQEAEPAAADEPAETAPFSVQVGVFASENDAHQLVRQLQKKGYAPIVLAANNDESRLLYSVRIGTYTNKTEAAHAASNIADQEKLKAVVRPLGSL